MSARAASVVVIMLAAVLAGCASDPSRGYSARSTMPAGVRTVAVSIFDNQTFQYGLEMELTDALIKEIQRYTPIVVVNGGPAESTLTGVIRRAELRDLTTSGRTGLVQEMAVELVVDFDWKDAASGQSLASVTNLKTAESFVASRRTGQRLETGREQATQEMARRIVASMRAEW